MAYQPQSLLQKEKLDVVLYHLDKTNDVDGDVIEIGCYQGGTLLQMHLVTPHRKHVIGYDTFEGLPEPTFHDKDVKDPHAKGDFSDTNYRQLMEYFSPFGVEIVKCHFPFGVSNRPISFCHLDVDFFKSTWDSLLFLNDNLSPGGRIVVDDYDWPRTPGVKKAVDQLVFSGMFAVISKTKECQVVLRRINEQ